MSTEKHHEIILRVRGYELDSYGHVNNAVYLQYLEQARWEFMNDNGLLSFITEKSLLLVVIETNIKYIREANIFDELIISTKCHAEAPFLIFHQRMINKATGLSVSRAKIKTLFVNKERVPQDIPSFIHDVIPAVHEK